MGFALLRCVIGRENSRFFLNQSDAKLKPVTIWSPAFCRALVELFLLWFVMDSKVIPCFWLADVIGLVWVIRHSIEKHFMYVFRVRSSFKAPHDLKSYFCKCTHIYDFWFRWIRKFFFQIFSCNSYVRKDFWCCMKNHLHLITS